MRKNRSWPAIIKALPKGLTFKQAAEHLDAPYSVVRYALHRYNYKALDGRHYCQLAVRKVVPEKIDWSMTNVEIARKLLVSRERIRIVRRGLGLAFLRAGQRKNLRNGKVKQPKA
jgi:transposase